MTREQYQEALEELRIAETDYVENPRGQVSILNFLSDETISVIENALELASKPSKWTVTSKMMGVNEPHPWGEEKPVTQYKPTLPDDVMECLRFYADSEWDAGCGCCRDDYNPETNPVADSGGKAQTILSKYTKGDGDV